MFFQQLKTKSVFDFRDEKIVLCFHQPGINCSSKVLAHSILLRLGISHRKERSESDKIHKVFIELVECMKRACKSRKPEDSVMTVEQMALYAGVSRQTFYPYVRRWLAVGIVKRATFYHEKKILRGYRLSATTIERAFENVIIKVNQNLQFTKKLVEEYTKAVKREKLLVQTVKRHRNETASFLAEPESDPYLEDEILE